MFRLIKKKKLQGNESVEKNEKSLINSESTSESIFPKAKEILEVSKQKWKEVTAEEILEKVMAESSRGRRCVTFYDSYISDKLVKELNDKGYKVKVQPLPTSIGPYFDIYW